MKRALAFGVVFMFAPTVHADTVDACVDGADRAQQLHDQGKLLEAREQLIACAAASCPSAVSKQCAKWLNELENEIPSITLRVRSSSGADVSEAEVTLDGASRAGVLGGRPILLDPGPHRFAFKRGDETGETSVVVRATEKNRLVDVRLVAPARAVVVETPQPIVHEPGFRLPWTTGVFLGVAVASFVSTGVLVAMASSDAANLRATCAPGCATSDVESAHTKLVVANVMVGVGILSIGVAAIFLIVANVTHHTARAAMLPTSIRF